MFERILELFFHAKAGALAGLLLIGTTGALVTATVSSSNNVTTITLTQASASPSGSARPSASPSHQAEATRSPKPSNSPSSSPASAAVTTAACTADTQAMSDAVKTVNTAFTKYHTDLMHMRNDPKSDAAKKIIDDTDKLLKTLRQNAVKDIHATSTCPKAEGDDADKTETDTADATDTTDTNDNTDQNDETDNPDKTTEKSSEKSSEKNFVVILFNNLFGNNKNTTTTATSTTSTTTTNTTLVTTGDPKAIADSAVAAMKLAFDDAAAKLKALPSASPKASKSPKVGQPDTKGKSQNKPTRSEREDD